MTSPESSFRDNLKSAADNLLPPFSESLHRRTLRALSQEQTRRTVTAQSSLWRRAMLPAAAALLLAGGIWYYTQPAPPSPLPIAQLPAGQLRPLPLEIAAPSATAFFKSTTEPLRTLAPSPAIRPLDDLQRQAQAVVQYFAGQIPTQIPVGAATPKAQPDMIRNGA